MTADPAGELPSQTCFALLDDLDASQADPRSRLYTDYAGTLAYDDAGGFPDLFSRLEHAFANGLHAVALFSYETGAHLQDIAPWDGPQRMPSQFLLFRHLQLFSAAQANDWLAVYEQQEDAGEQPAGIARLKAETNADAFGAAVARIRDYIEAGDTYQVNLTYRIRFSAYGSVAALYRRLRERQPVPYGALIALPDGGAVLSFSPELFVRHHNDVLTAQPMKGTAPATDDEAENRARALALAADPKNRAENLMIVDLLRNDLGKVAVNGSVRVPALFDVTRYNGVLQMTSTVQARLQHDASLADLLAALYPCGSITGAPKRRTMQIIRDLETSPRGWYTGAIGWFDRPREGMAVGDFCLSVPIRTLVLHAPGDADAGTMRSGQMGVGAGIVHDSVAADEWTECEWKTRFLTGLRPAFTLFETMRVSRSGGCLHHESHRQRMQASALTFGFPWRETDFDAAVSAACASLCEDGEWRLKLSLDASGTFATHAAPLAAPTLPVAVLIASGRMRSTDPFLRHKTSVRRRYDEAWRQAEKEGAFDMLFFNERGELTEGGRSNVFVRRNGRWITPPLACGVLPGVMRGAMLRDPAWNAAEGLLRIEDLRHAEALVVCNALRGAMPAWIDWETSAKRESASSP